jgi:hypothetical protein
MGEFLHGADNLGHPASAVQALVDGAGNFRRNEIQVAVPFGLLQGGSHPGWQFPIRIMNRGAIPLKQLADCFPGVAQEGEIVGHELRGRVDFVGNAGGQLTDAFELLRLPELALQHAPLGDVFLDSKKVSN